MKTVASTLVVARIPRVNLMPGAEIERMARQALVRRWLIALLAAIAVMALAGTAVFVVAADADRRLAAEQVRAALLSVELENLSDLREAIHLRDELDRFRTEVLGTDFSQLLEVSAVAVAVPE